MIDDPDLNLAMWQASSPLVAAAHAVYGPLPPVTSEEFLTAPVVVRQATLVVVGISRVHLGDPVRALLREASSAIHDGADPGFWASVAGVYQPNALSGHVSYEELGRRRAAPGPMAREVA